jgi:hypothetical protein
LYAKTKFYTEPMRITPREQEVIKRTAQECFDAAVVVRLFGSRTDDAKKGGGY